MPKNVYIFENEASFEVRSPDDKVLAEFSIQQLTLEEIQRLKLLRDRDYYQARQGEKIIVYHGQDKRKAIESAYQAACFLARQFGKGSFDDLSNLADGELVQTGGVLVFGEEAPKESNP